MSMMSPYWSSDGKTTSLKSMLPLVFECNCTIYKISYCKYMYVEFYISVVDIYQEWSGPTKALYKALKRHKIDVGSDPFLSYYLVRKICVAVGG